jgi:quinoprotein glucose dehydrogenase
VHHDLWDYDNASPPALVTVMRNGREIPAVVLATKTGMLFVLNRDTGEPVFPVEERAVPEHIVEEASPTQRSPPSRRRSAPTGHHRRCVGPTPESQAAPRADEGSQRGRGPRCRVSKAPRGATNIGGAHWGGRPTIRRIAVVPAVRIAALVQLLAAEGLNIDSAEAASDRAGED